MSQATVSLSLACDIFLFAVCAGFEALEYRVSGFPKL